MNCPLQATTQVTKAGGLKVYTQPAWATVVVQSYPEYLNETISKYQW